MPVPSLEAQRLYESASAYAANWEHLSDELQRLDLLIQLRLARERGKTQSTPPTIMDQFKGLVISDEEVSRLLTDTSSRGPDSGIYNSDGVELQELAQSLGRFESHIQERLVASAGETVYLALPYLARLFHLTPFETQIVLLCLAPEIDSKYKRLYAYLQDDVTRKKPSVALALDLLCGAHAEKIAMRSVFDSQAPLIKYRLLRMTDNQPEGPEPLLTRPLKLDDRIVNFALGLRTIDARLETCARLIPANEKNHAPEVSSELLNRTLGFIQSHFGESEPERRNLIFYLSGPAGSDRRALVENICHSIGLDLVVADVEKMLSNPSSFEETVWLLGRESLLQPSALCLEHLDCLIAEPEKHRPSLNALIEAFGVFSRLAFLLGDQDWRPRGLSGREMFITLEFPQAEDRSGKRLWESQLKSHYQFAEDVDFEALASKFRMQPGWIRDALSAAETLARWRSPEAAEITMDDLHAACRAQSTPKLGALARKIIPRYEWEDIVLPDDQLAQLREMRQQALYRSVVYRQWGFERKLSRGKGLNALFSGPPGTGKTMAAEVIARDLRLDLYQIDLSQVVSKYIGETEKNLGQIFREAQSSDAILFFDEADALFGKRSEVKDAHDRYANIEVGYLLQKMEEYEGIAILATNLRQHLDDAFVRRMQFIVEFPFPDEDGRRRIWNVIFPREAPLGEDVDFGALAREVKLAGGNIKNIGLASAFYAASDGRVIRMSHLIRAARREFQKLGRTWDEAQWGLK
jgi:Winged helix domain, variant/ATPase family associated with various cellular activities (AAA)